MLRTIKRNDQEAKSTKLTRASVLYQQASRLLLRAVPFFPSKQKYNLTICHAKKFMWFRVAKVATRTIFQIFDDAHIPLDAEHAMQCHYPVQRYHDYFKFAFVRNPWDRLVACWHNKVVEQNHFHFSAETWVNMQNFPGFVDYIMANRSIIQRDAHLRPQSALIDLNELDYLGRFEHLAAHLTEISQILGLGNITIPHKNASKRDRDYRIYYDDASCRKVAEIYQKDIRMFSYQF